MGEPDEAIDPRPLRALLVEDSRLDAELLLVHLERSWPGVQLQVLREEAEYTGALAAGGWDVILSDYELPGFTGADLLDHRNRLAPDTPFIFVSGVNAYVVKPVEFKQFVAAIADLGVFWAVLNEPPPGSLRANRRYE